MLSSVSTVIERREYTNYNLKHLQVQVGVITAKQKKLLSELVRVVLTCNLHLQVPVGLLNLSIFSWLPTKYCQCKDNSRGVPNKPFILRSHSVHISFTVRSPFTLCSRLRSVCALRWLTFIFHQHSPNSVQRALTVRSSLTHRSVVK